MKPILKLISIDPGRHTGYAFFFDGVLRVCGLIEANCAQAIMDTFSSLVERSIKFHDSQPILSSGLPLSESENALVIELPQVYTEYKKWKGDPNNLIKVAIIAGMCASTLEKFAEAEFVTPARWKHSRDKKIDNPVTLATLSQTETIIYNYTVCSITKSKRHNVIDAIGLGLWKLKRR